ncbi:MAG: YggS family pyridoxal phosphate-dependent enzyme [Luteimonas sp.]
MLAQALQRVTDRLGAAASDAQRAVPRLLAVSKLHPASAVAELAACGQRAFGENYVQEALAKQAELRSLNVDVALEWHLIGHLQSNKARAAAVAFDWVQTVDRAKLVGALAQHRPDARAPLNVLIQVNIADEASKHGCTPQAIDGLVDAIAAQPQLLLRGLMAIPAPHPDPALRRAAFARMRELFEALRVRAARVDTLSMGMSDDIELAIAEGATMVRVGTALFGTRSRDSGLGIRGSQA